MNSAKTGGNPDPNIKLNMLPITFENLALFKILYAWFKDSQIKPIYE